MSNFFLADRIKETSRVEGQVPISLDGSVAGFSSFDDFYASGDVVFYAITDNSKYEVGSGVYEMIGSTRSITRFPMRSSDMNSGPYYVDGTSSEGNGFHYPLWLTKSAAQSGVGFSDGPYTAVSGITFDEFPGEVFYYATEHAALAVGSTAGSGASWGDASDPVDFQTGLKEVFITYPGKTAVYNAYGIKADILAPQESGVAIWKNGQILNYTGNLVWDDANKRLGIDQPNPQYSVDIGGVPAHSFVNASGYIEGGSGILFSGGQLTYTGKTASGGKQLEPFLRNQLGDGADTLIQLSGLVDQFIGLRTQSPGMVLAGPDPDYCGTGNCPPQVPTFRLLELGDIPLGDLTTSGNFVIQNNAGLDSQSANITPNNYTVGMVAIYAGSGSITYDSGIYFDAVNNRLLVGGDASTDTPIHTLDARGNIGGISGYFNQLLFTDDLIRLGVSAGTNDGNLTENFYGISIGNSAGAATSGNFDCLYVGRSAGLNATECSGLAGVGRSAGASTQNLREVFAGALSAAEGARNVASGVTVGQFAGSELVDSEYVAIIGQHAAHGGSGLIGIVAIGELTARNASGVVDSVMIGQFAGRNSRQIANNVAIGNGAGSAAVLSQDSVHIGSNAGNASSGINSVYIGRTAGLGTNGNGNIEISNSSFPRLAGQTVANRIVLGSSFVGDDTLQRVSVGDPSGLYPIATLVVEPSDENEAAFIVRVVDSGSITPPVQVQSGDGTTFYSVSNSGNVFSAGWMQPSGGLFLNAADPTRNSGVNGYTLWNDGGTLVWNGSPVGGAGSFTSWTATTQDAMASVTDGQAVIFSGVSGLDITNVGPRSLIFNGAELSGICVELSGQISASEYAFDIFASGAGSNNNDPKTMDKNSVLAMSGVSGINIDFTNQNNSGIFTIGYDVTNTYSFNVTNGEVANDIITNTETVTISGVSGVRAEMEDIAGGAIFRIAAPELSGVFRNDIDAANSGTTMVSGIAVWSSGEFSRLGLGSTEGASGVKLQDAHYIMDEAGTGNLNVLNFPYGRIKIGSYPTSSVYSTQNVPGVILIGSGTGDGAITYGDDHVVAIGTDAMGGNSQGARYATVAIGYKAFGSEPNADTRYCIAVGYNALTSSSGNYNIGIGYQAGLQGSLSFGGRKSHYNISLGHEAGKDQDEGTLGRDVSIGVEAGRHQYSGGQNVSIGYGARGGNGSSAFSQSVTNSVAIGTSAGYNTKNCYFNVDIGHTTGGNASGVSRYVNIGFGAGNNLNSSVIGGSIDRGINIGYFAGNGAEDCDRMVAIGESAGSTVSGCDYSSFIGAYAGYKRSGSESIIIRNRTAFATTYDADWAPHDESNIIDIGEAFQGKATDSNVNMHIGHPLNNSNRDLSSIEDAALNVTPSVTDDSALIINLAGSDPTNQAAGLVKSEQKAGGSIQAALNEIVNQDGVLRLPKITSKSGTYPNVQLTTNTGNIVDPDAGVVCTYELGADRGLAVSLYDSGAGKYVWYKIATSTLF